VTFVLEQKRKDESTFGVKPNRGSLAPGKKIPITFQFMALKVGSFETSFVAKVEGVDSEAQHFLVRGSSEEAKVEVDSREVYFKPTPQGSASYRVISVINRSHIPVHYWVFPIKLIKNCC
jgi:hypothetical protein